MADRIIHNGDTFPADGPRIAVLDDYDDAAAGLDCWSALAGGARPDFYPDHLADPDALVERLAGYPIVVAMRERTAFPAQVIERLPELRLLVTTGLRNAAIDTAAAARAGVTVCGTRMSAYAAAELTWALVLELTRRAGAQDASVRAGGWQAGVGTELDGRVLGLLGLGRLGTRVAGYARAFGMEVLAWSPNLTPERAEAAGVRAVPRERVFAEADVVSVHLRLSELSRGLVGTAELAAMKPTAYLVNTSRGPIVDEAALVEALHAGRIAGAGLDVFDVEPLPAGHPLLTAPRTVLTPHIGYVTDRSMRVAYGDAVEAVNGWLAGTPVRVIEG